MISINAQMILFYNYQQILLSDSSYSLFINSVESFLIYMYSVRLYLGMPNFNFKNTTCVCQNWSYEKLSMICKNIVTLKFLKDALMIEEG